MSSVEKRRSGRKSGGHRKHSDGGYSDTSSSGSFLDETDREVSNLTDRAFRSLCIGDEAVYNDSDLCPSSPCSQRDRQLAFSRGQDREWEKEDLKRSAHDSFSLRVQQYEQDWIHAGTYGAEIHRDPQWEVYGERTQGRVSATFHHSSVETSQQEQSLREDQLSLLCNGATELRSQQRRSRSRVSSLIRAFDSDRHRDAAEADSQLGEGNNHTTSWDSSALMSLQRELSEFSTSYQQNFNSDHFHTAAPFSSWDANFYSSEEAALGRMNSYTSASHSKHSMSTQVNCNPNVFIHSEFSPFRVWRDHNRFPFQQGEVSGFMHSSEFPKWYQTPMYKELSQEAQPRGPHRFEGHQRNNLLPVVPHTPPRSTSTSTMLQRAAAVEKRSESELAGHCPHRKRAQSLGTNRLPSQRPSTASPATEISPHVRDTISSVRALQQKIKMMTEQSMATVTAANQRGALWSKDDFTAFGNNRETLAPNVRSNTTPHDLSQMLTYPVPANQETSLVPQYAVSPQPVEHAPVRAESRGATPDVRTASYRSRATSLLFNLKDNRKRVKNTYSPTKFKNMETPDKHKQPSIPEPSDTVIDIPDLPDPGLQFTQADISCRTNAASYPYLNHYQSPGNSHHATQFSEYAVSGYQTAQPPGEMVHHSRFTGFMPENYITTQMANGQNPHEDLLPYTPYRHYMTHNIESLGGDVYGAQQSYRAAQTTQQNTANNQNREYFQANAEQHFNETVGREYTKVDRYQQFKDNKQYNDYSNVSSQDRWRQTNSQDAEMLSRKAAISPWKQEITALIEKDRHTHRAGRIEEQTHSPRDKNDRRGDNQHGTNKEPDMNESRQRFDVAISSYKNMGLVDSNFSQRLPHYSDVESQAYYGRQQPGASRDKYVPQNDLTPNYRYTNDEHYSNKHQTKCTQETGQRKVSLPKGQESVQSVQATPQLENNMQKNLICHPVNVAAATITNQVKDMQPTEVRAEKATAGRLEAQHAQAELAEAQHQAQVEKPEAESAGLIIAAQTGSEKVKAEQAKATKTECERATEAKAEHVEEEKRKRDQTEKYRENHPERERAEETKVEKARRQEVREEAEGVPEEDKQVNAQPERLKEEHITTSVAQAEQGHTGERVKEQHVKTEQEKMRVVEVRPEKPKDDSVKALNAEQPATQSNQTREAKTKKQTKLDLAEAEQTKTDLAKLQERLAKPGAKPAVTQQVKGETDKVEQVKTELAKAKAELAKITEKMRGEQKEKVKETIVPVEDVSLAVNMIQSDKYTNEPGSQTQQKKEDTLFSKSGRAQTTTTDNHDNMKDESAARNDSLNVNSQTQTLSPDTVNDKKSKDKRTHGPNTEHEQEDSSFKSHNLTECNYVYSESSKEFKLFTSDHLPTNAENQRSSDADKPKNHRLENIEKSAAVKHIDDSQQRDSDLTKLGPPERKPKSAEQSAGPAKDPHPTPPRALSHKERAQTKQEILTSRIKAHAEKEISAIKEKGFAIRDGFMSKNLSKQAASIQSMTIRQRPASQEVLKKHESTVSTNVTPKHQLDTVKSTVSHSSTGQSVDNPQWTERCTDHVSATVRDVTQVRYDNIITDESVKEHQKNQKDREQPGVKSSVQTQQQSNDGTTSGKLKNGLKQDASPAAEAPSKDASAERTTTEKAQSQHTAGTEDSAPSLSSACRDQNQTPVADDSLQILGIMVTTEDRTEQEMFPTQRKDQTKISVNHHPENLQENLTLTRRKNNVSEELGDVQESSSTDTRPQQETQLHEPLTGEGVQQTPATGPASAKNNVSAKTRLQVHIQDIDTSDSSRESSTRSTRKDEVKETEEKHAEITQTSENVLQMEKTGLNSDPDPNRAHAEALFSDDVQSDTGHRGDVQLSSTKDVTSATNPWKSSEVDVISAPLLEEERHDPPQLKPFNNSPLSLHLPENENRCVPPKLPYEETQPGDHVQAGDDVHIDSIAIRVVPAASKGKPSTAGNRQLIIVSPDVVAATDQPKIASSSCEEKVGSSSDTVSNKGVSPTCSEQQMKDSLEEKVQLVLSSVRTLSDSLKISNQHNSIHVNTQAASGNPEKVHKCEKSVDKSNIQALEGGYFQVQGATEINNEIHNGANVSQGGELPELLQNKAPVSNKPQMEVKNTVFVLDQSTKTAVDSSSGSVQNDKTENKELENEGKLSSKLRERQSNMEKTDPGQTNHVRKHSPGSQSNSSSRERLSSRHSQPTRETTANEKPEVKAKPKERLSTIPDISAIADYARLKVIVSEEQENTIQEFPPNKKEGFFPLIQTRHSRRPVFTVDPKDVPVKERNVPKKTEVPAKVNKEPKTLVFPITEKEHQRTGMFKLGEKDRQEKVALSPTGVVDVRDKNTSLTSHLKSQKKKEQTSTTDMQKLHQTIPQPDNSPPQTQTTTPSSVVNRPRNTPTDVQLRSPSNSHEKIPIVDKDSNTKPTNRQSESTTTLRNNEMFENEKTKTVEESEGKPRQKGLSTQPEEPTAKLSEEASWIEKRKRAEELRIKHILEKSKASLAEEERRAAQREEERRAKEREAIAMKIKERREKQREADKRAEEDRKAKQIKAKQADRKEEEIRAKQGEEERRAKEAEREVTEEERRAKRRGEEALIRANKERMRLKLQEERASQKVQQGGATQEEQQRTAVQEQQERKPSLEEQRGRDVQEKNRKTAEGEQQKRALQKEQQARGLQEDKQRRAGQDEQQRRSAQEEQQRRAAQEEQQRRAAQEEQQRRSAQDEQQRKASQEERQRRVLLEEQQRREAIEEQQREAAKEQRRRAAQEEQQRQAAQEEQQRQAAQEEQQRRAAQEEQRKREEEQRRAALEEQQRRSLQREQQRRAAEVELQRKAALEEQQREAAKEQQRRALQEEQNRKAELEDQQRRVALIEKPRQAEHTEETTVTKTVEEKKRRQRGEEDRNPEREKEKSQHAKQREEAHVREESQAEEESRGAREPPSQREDEVAAKRREEEERVAGRREEEKVVQAEEQRRSAQMVDALQYYAITSTQPQKKPKDPRQLCSPLPSQQKHNSSVQESAEDTGSHSRLSRPHCPPSPAPSLPRSNTSSPALGAKPSMFRVKDNTIRGSSFTKSVKPRFHKNFGDDFQVGPPMERIDGIGPTNPVNPEAGINKLVGIRDFSSSRPASSSQDHSAHLLQHRPYSRRSIALEEEDSRSVISNMSEDVESLALSAADLAEVRGLYDYDRPESACSYSSDVSRTMGKPPVVPPKSEKALLRAKRLTSRRMKKESSRSVENSHAGVERPQQDVSGDAPACSSTETHSSNPCVVASPHFSSPISLARAPTPGSASLPSHKEHSSSHHSAHTSPHVTCPVSLPTASPHATASASQTAVVHVSSSPAFSPANQPAPVTQYHLESSYPPSFPLTQRKVLQDLGSGQYFVVDVPVQVKTKTFFDPETGKYVQLNVRESGKSNAQPKLQQTYPHTQPHGPASTAGKPFVLHQGHHGFSQGFQPAAVHSAPPHRSSDPVTLHQNQQPVRENLSCGYPAPDVRRNPEGHRYSPEKTPYMDTVNDSMKTYNRVYSTHGSYDAFPECDTNSQLAGSAARETDNSAHSRYQPRDIITMSELEDFMEVSDW